MMPALWRRRAAPLPLSKGVEVKWKFSHLRLSNQICKAPGWVNCVASCGRPRLQLFDRRLHHLVSGSVVCDREPQSRFRRVTRRTGGTNLL
jgi:hypothetical protein